jgi:hypothetical protein
MNRFLQVIITSLLLFSFSLCLSWDGYDWESGEYIEIDKGNLVRNGEEIEVYHWEDGSYHEEEVQGMNGDELETYDYDAGEYNYYEMD